MSEKRAVQEALNRSLSGLRENPLLARQVIAQAKGEEKMKKHLSRGMVLALALMLVLVGSAYAAFSSQVAEFFGKHWNPDLGDWLKDGKIAQVGESCSIGGVSLTLDEVVYRSRGLYAVGTVRAMDGKDVLIPMDLADGLYEPGFYDQSDEAQALFHQAKEKGGNVLRVDVTLDGIGVDGGEMLTPGSVGWYNVLNEDGTLTFSFETEDGYALEDGARYTLDINVSVKALDERGEALPGAVQEGSWMVACEPKWIAEPTQAPQQADTGALIPQGDYELLLPEEYRQTGTLPVYRAAAANLKEIVQPEWFNQSGIAQQDSYTITFMDHATLSVSSEGLYYAEYTDEMYDYNTKERETYHPNMEPDLHPKMALSQMIVHIASWERLGSEGAPGNSALEKTQLTYLSLDDAKAQVEELMEKLGIREGYACTAALDMSIDRIQAWGAAYNQAIHDGKIYTNLPEYDYSAVAPEEEGYYLTYDLMGVDQANQGRFSVTAYVSKRGIAYANIRNDFIRGEAAYTPDSLIAPETAVQRLGEEISRSRSGGKIEKILRVALTYAPVRAENKAEGMLFTPMWQVLYQDENATRQDYTCYAEFNAVDGTLLDAMFR